VEGERFIRKTRDAMPRKGTLLFTFLFCLCSCAFAGESQTAGQSHTPDGANGGHETGVIICFDPVSGKQTEINRTASPSGNARCPDGYVAYPLFSFEKVAGAPPVPFGEEQHNRQEQQEAPDAPPGNK
jgi:hypothetical protein